MLEYRLKANTTKKGEPIFFANPNLNKVEKLKEKCGNEFKIVFYRTEGAMETYAIPFSALQNALTHETLNKEAGKRWLTTIIDGWLIVSFGGGKKLKINVSIYLEFELSTEVFKGDCVEGLKQIPDETVDGICTSPPYKEEDGYSEELMRGWLKESFRILKQNTCLFMNFGHLAGMKERGFEVATMAVEIGFVWNDTITWIKNHYTPLNVPYRVNNLTEYIFLLTKGKPKLNKLSISVPYGMPWTVNPGEPAPENAHFTKSVLKRYGRNEKCGGNVWYIKYEPKRRPDPLINGDRHKDRYPVELPLRAMKLADMQGTIVDPFNGSGTTGVACIKFWQESERKMKFIGFELNPEHVRNTRKWWIRMREGLNMNLDKLIEAHMKEMNRCRRCNRELTDEKSIQEGIGPVCKELEDRTHRVTMWELLHGDIPDPDNGWNPAWVSDDFDTWLEDRTHRATMWELDFEERQN